MTGCGAGLSVYLHFFPQRRLFTALRRFLGGGGASDGKKVSSFGASAAALAGSLGTGNIAGVAAALTAGGPGAVFWMWVSAFGGIALKYSEILLAAHGRRKGDSSGPMGYIARNVGPVAAWVFAFGCVGASFGTGNMAQANAAADALHTAFGLPKIICGLFLGLAAFLVLRGGKGRVASAAGFLIPVVGGLYIAGAGAVLLLHLDRLPGAFCLVFSDAFSFQSVSGGVLGVFVSRAFRAGIARGVFTNEAGLGSAPIVHSAADSSSPADEGLWGVAEVALDTLVMCTLTAAVLLVAPSPGADGAAWTAAAFSSALGDWAGGFLGASSALLAFASLLTWHWCGGSGPRLSRGRPAGESALPGGLLPRGGFGERHSGADGPFHLRPAQFFHGRAQSAGPFPRPEDGAGRDFGLYLPKKINFVHILWQIDIYPIK